jgi:hypothetical protein
MKRLASCISVIFVSNDSSRSIANTTNLNHYIKNCPTTEMKKETPDKYSAPFFQTGNEGTDFSLLTFVCK